MFEGLFQPMHLLVIFFIALLVFGQEIAGVGQGAGRGHSRPERGYEGSRCQG